LDASKLQLNQNPFICERFAKRFSQSHGSQLRDSANGVRRVITEVVGRTQCERNRCPRRPRATIQVASGHREECSTLPPLPGAHGSSSSKKGNICNLLAILIAIYLYVAMQPSLRFNIFFAQHQTFFVAFSLSILGYV
jgi:hypothetical protein